MDMELSQDGGYEFPPRKSMKSKPVGPLRSKWQKLSHKKKITLGLLAVLSLVVVWGTALAINVATVYSDLSRSKTLIKEIGSSLGEGNTDVSDPLISELETRLTQSSCVVSGSLWKSGGFIPFLGANLAAVRITTDSVNNVFQDAGLPALKTQQREDLGRSVGSFGITMRPQEHAVLESVFVIQNELINFQIRKAPLFHEVSVSLSERTCERSGNKEK